MAQRKQPNFLFIIADQLRADHLGCYGNHVVRTPNIDRLAAEGFVADRFFVASPICMPNRASLLTGRMPSLHGVRHNGIPLSLRATTFVERLRENGYRTALVGKSHLQNMTGKPAVWPRDPADRLGGEAVAPDGGRYDQEWKPNWRDRPEHDVAQPSACCGERGGVARKRRVKTVSNRVGACLRHHRPKRPIRSANGLGKCVAWEVAQ